jgi:hypothetical protein
MSNSTIHNFWKSFLETAEVSRSSVPKSVLRTSQFKAFFNGQADGAIILEKNGRGSTYKINERKRNIIQQYFDITFPNSLDSVNNKFQSTLMFRNSKASKQKDKSIFFIKGYKPIKLNGIEFDLKHHTEMFGIVAILSPQIEFKKICFVENKDVFLEIESLLGFSYLYIHKYGRIGKNDIKLFKTEEILVFSDYDYIGLNEYLTIKREFANTNFYIPENYDELYDKYSRPIPERQIPSELVSLSNEDIVVKIRTKLQKENYYLEQQSLFEFMV